MPNASGWVNRVVQLPKRLAETRRRVGPGWEIIFRKLLFTGASSRSENVQDTSIYIFLLTGTAVRCRYKPWGAHQPHCGKGSCASMHGIPLKPTGQADALGLENVSPSSPIISHFLDVTSVGC